MTTLAMTKWCETPCFYPLPYPVTYSGCCHLLFHLTRSPLSCQPSRHPLPQHHEIPGSHQRGAAGSFACWDPEWYPSSWNKCILQAAALLLLADTCRGSPLYLWLVFSSLPVKAASLRRCIISKGGASASSARLCQQAF